MQASNIEVCTISSLPVLLHSYSICGNKYLLKLVMFLYKIFNLLQMFNSRISYKGNFFRCWNNLGGDSSNCSCMLTACCTGLKPIQQRKLLRVAKDYCGSDVPSESLSATNYCVPVKYDRFGQGEIVDSMSCQSVTTSVRYIMCQDLFVKEAKEKVVIQLYLNVTTIRDLVVRICANEGIQLDSYTLELFTQEGYPININNYNEDCELWNFLSVDISHW